MVTTRPESCAVAFKEWAGVCDALIEGRQSVVIRKGGVSESAGPGKFTPEHAEFWLYPTWVHQAEQGMRTAGGEVPTARRATRDGSIAIRALVRIDLIGYVEREQSLSPLRELHVLTDETIMKRFHYRRPGLWLIGARVWRRDPGFALAPLPDQAGCKTWVRLDEPLPTTGLEAVLDDAEWAVRRQRLRSILDCDGKPGQPSRPL